MNPYLIDEIVDANVLKQSLSGKYYISKPVQYLGFSGFLQRIHHAFLVFSGRATAVQFKEDFDDVYEKSIKIRR